MRPSQWTLHRLTEPREIPSPGRKEDHPLVPTGYGQDPAKYFDYKYNNELFRRKSSLFIPSYARTDAETAAGTVIVNRVLVRIKNEANESARSRTLPFSCASLKKMLSTKTNHSLQVPLWSCLHEQTRLTRWWRRKQAIQGSTDARSMRCCCCTSSGVARTN